MRRILLVEDHASFRQTLALVFDQQPEVEVVAQAGTLAEARRTMEGLEADLGVIDLTLPDGEGTGLIVEDGFPATISGPAGVEVARVVQEALANVRRHSGARHAVVTLGMVNGEVLVEIEDDGRGFGPETSYGMGLTGMRERVLVLGGELEVEGREGMGTRVFLRVSLGLLTGGETGERSNT